MSNKFVYKQLISTVGTNPSLYKDDEAIYALVTNSSEDSVWIDLYMSYDDGDSWFLDKYLPIDTLKLYDAKIVSSGENKYIFAHGINDYGVDTVRFIKYELYLDSEDIYSWDDEWSDFFTDYVLHARVTDLKVDLSQQYIYVTYDKLNLDMTYGVYLAIYSLTTHQIVFNKPICISPSKHQHNAKLIQIASSTFFISWEEENDLKKNQIRCCYFTIAQEEFSSFMELSTHSVSDSRLNHYHHSIAIDNYANVHVTWLETKDNFDTSSVQYVNIVNDIIGEVQTVSETAENNKYPCVMCDEYDNVYILYNYASQKESVALKTMNYLDLNVRYLVKEYDSVEWRQISDITGNNWNVLSGWCSDKNIYSLILENNELYFLRIDTAIAEIFKEVDDFAITNITNNQISFSWSKARNAEVITLQMKDEDNYVDATLVEPLSATDTWAKAVDLVPGKYKFRVIYKDLDLVDRVQYIPQEFELTEPEFKVSWEPNDNAIMQVLQYTIESWSDVDVISNKVTSSTFSFQRAVTQFRLSITGGVAAGYSNVVAPLDIEFDDNTIKLSWQAIKGISTLKLQESIDGIHWYDAYTKDPLKITDTSCEVQNISNVVYHYRLYHTNSNGNISVSNSVTIANNLKVLSTTYNSITLHWIDVVMNEGKYFQYSDDHGISWKSALLPTNETKITISGLDYDKEYYVRIFFPNRYTGEYSNTVITRTKKKPISDLHIISQEQTSAVLGFSTNETFSDVEIALSSPDTIDVYKLNDLPEHEIKDHIVNDLWAGYDVTFKLNSLLKGEKYFVYVTPLDSRRGGISNVISIETYGDGIPEISLSDITAHSVNVHFGELSRITDENIADNVEVYYTNDDINIEHVPVMTLNDFTLTNLMQDTKYFLYVRCHYGDNEGESEKISFVTQQDSFKAVSGTRVPGECVFCKTDDSYYIMDRGILYKVSGDTQEMLYDFKLKCNRIYSSIASDVNGVVHILYSCNKELYYVNTNDLEDHILIAQNLDTNEIMFPQLKIAYDNTLYVVYEENFGYYSVIKFCSIRNNKIISEPKILLNDMSLNSTIKIALKDSHTENAGSNGFYACTMSTDNVIKIIDYVIDNDKESETYKIESISTEAFEIDDNYEIAYNDIDLESDNLDTPHIFYSSFNDDSRTMTYASIVDKDLARVVFNNCVYAKIIPMDSLIALIVYDKTLFTSKYSAESIAFTDRKEIGQKLQGDFVNCICDREDIDVLSFKNGKFFIQTFKIADIEATNNYIAGRWIDNVFELSDDECDISIWTDGDIHDYPLMYVKINGLVSDITPRDNNGDPTEKDIVITSLDTTDDTYVYRIEMNGEEKIFDANKRLVYDWDPSEIVNEK